MIGLLRSSTAEEMREGEENWRECLLGVIGAVICWERENAEKKLKDEQGAMDDDADETNDSKNDSKNDSDKQSKNKEDDEKSTSRKNRVNGEDKNDDNDTDDETPNYTFLSPQRGGKNFLSKLMMQTLTCLLARSASGNSPVRQQIAQIDCKHISNNSPLISSPLPHSLLHAEL